MAGERFRSIQAGRAFAALIVVFHHLEWIYPHRTSIVAAVPTFLSFGYAGVDFFFVISGFIISAVVAREEVSPSSFFSRRFVRILPMYWVFSLAWIVLLKMGARPLPSFSEIVLSLSAFPQLGPPVLGVGWSLEHELIFYILVGLCLALGKFARLPYILSAFFIVGVVVHVIINGERRVWDFHIFSLYQFDFLLGVILFRMRTRFPKINGWASFVLGIGIWSATTVVIRPMYLGHVQTNPEGFLGAARVMLMGSGSFLMLLGLLKIEKEDPALFETGPGRALVVLGNASFALYLVHPHVLIVTGRLLSALRLGNSWDIPAAMAAVLTSIAVALIWYNFVESPLLKWAHKRI